MEREQVLYIQMCCLCSRTGSVLFLLPMSMALLNLPEGEIVLCYADRLKGKKKPAEEVYITPHRQFCLFADAVPLVGYH